MTIENLQLRLPVLESPGALGGLVRLPGREVRAARLRSWRPTSRPCRIPGRRARRRCGCRSSRRTRSARRRNSTHGPPLAFSSCSPPELMSDFLTAGTPDANGEAPAFDGLVKLRRAWSGNPSTPRPTRPTWRDRLAHGRPQPGRPDRLHRRAAGDARRCGSPTASAGRSATSRPPSWTCRFPWRSRARRRRASAGATCSVTTTMDAVMPGAVPEGKRSIWRARPGRGLRRWGRRAGRRPPATRCSRSRACSSRRPSAQPSRASHCSRECRALSRHSRVS